MARVKRGNKVKKQTTGNSVAKSGFKKSRGKQSAATTGLKRAGVVRDARLKIIAKNRSQLTDAREKLAALAKTTDARQKLEKIRNRKAGKLDVKTTAKGGITITTTTKGALMLTTAKKLVVASHQNTGNKNRKQANAKKGSGDNLIRRQPGGGVTKNRTPNSGSVGRRDERRNGGARPDNRPHHQQQRRRSPDQHQRNQMEYSNAGRHTTASRHRPSHYDYDDPRKELEQLDDVHRRHLQYQDRHSDMLSGRTLADRITETGGNYSSPLQGTKVVVSNLQPTVTQEDIMELFGDVGPLKRAKVAVPGTAEVVYVNMNDALKAVEVYHNRQLDGRSMKCQIVGVSMTSMTESKISSLSRGSGGGAFDSLSPDISAIHKALFNDNKKRTVPNSSARPQFKITMGKSGSRR